MPDRIFLNANVITMDAARPSAEAVVVEGGRIAFVGGNAEARGVGGGGGGGDGERAVGEGGAAERGGGGGGGWADRLRGRQCRGAGVRAGGRGRDRSGGAD